MLFQYKTNKLLVRKEKKKNWYRVVRNRDNKYSDCYFYAIFILAVKVNLLPDILTHFSLLDFRGMK